MHQSRFGSFEYVEELYRQVVATHSIGDIRPLALDLSLISFLPAEGLLALLSITRLWYRWTGTRTVLTGMQLSVHRYLEHMDLFTQCAHWLEQEYELIPEERFDRSSASNRLLEIMHIASDEQHNALDATDAIRRAQRILMTWFDVDMRAVGRLLTILSEIGSNVSHSQDEGFIVIQRYRDKASSSCGSRVTVAIADLGIGIERALRHKDRCSEEGNDTRFRSGSDYIHYALQLGVTSRDAIAGMGLPQVKGIVEDWRGTLTIRSVKSIVHFSENACTVQDNCPEIPGTQVTISVRGPLGTEVL